MPQKCPLVRGFVQKYKCCKIFIFYIGLVISVVMNNKAFDDLFFKPLLWRQPIQ